MENAPILRKDKKRNGLANFVPVANFQNTSSTNKSNQIVKFNQRDVNISPLDQVQTLKDLIVDTTKLLGRKKGDLNLAHTITYRARLDGFEHGLVIKRIECLDESVYQIYMHELGILKDLGRFPYVTSIFKILYEKSKNPYTYMNIYPIFYECEKLDLQSYIFNKGIQLKESTAMKYITQMALGISTFHYSREIHGGIRPSNLFIDEMEILNVGPIKKSDLESMRKTKQLLSRFVIYQYLSRYIAYWAPEVILDRPLTLAIDIWALGIVAFQLISGSLPFEALDEEQTIDSIVKGNIQWTRIKSRGRAFDLINNCLQVDPLNRWDISIIVEYCQQDYARKIQRWWRVRRNRDGMQKKIKGLIIAQRMVRINEEKKRNEKERQRKENLKQQHYKGFVQTVKAKMQFLKKERSISYIQRRFLAMKAKRNFKLLKADVTVIQALIRRYLSYTAYKLLSEERLGLLNQISGVNSRMKNLNNKARLYFRHYIENEETAQESIKKVALQ